VTVPAAPLQLTGWTEAALLGILGFGLLAAVVATAFAFVFRALSARSTPVGVTAILGLGAVAAVLNATAVSGSSLVAGTEIVYYGTGAYLLGVFVTGSVGAEVGRRLGDHVARDVFDVAAIDASGEAAAILQSAALVTPVELPAEIADLAGYATVGKSTKRRLAGRELVVPEGLSNAALESRLRARIRRDFDVDSVHVDVDDDRTVRSLAVGRQPGGVGPLLAPRTVALAVEGDPAPDASTGDPVELWPRGDGSNEPVATGSVQATDGDVTTLAVDADDVDAVTPGETYRLLARSGEPSDVHELVATLRETDATVTKATVEEGGPLHGEFADWLPVTVLVIERDGERIPFPAANETLEPGDTVHVLGTPEGLHRFANYEPEREPVNGASPDDERASPESESERSVLAGITGD